jgi:hypothetical protein
MMSHQQDAAMNVVTWEATVEGGQIRLPPDVQLPDHTKVYVVVPGVEAERAARIASPRVVRPEQHSAFAMEIIKAEPDADV